jgi:sporulation protein YlmC with PRC-barrel domain
MTEELRQRSDLLGTQVITRTTGKRLGVVSQLWVDVDHKDVVALSIRPSLFYGTPQPMMLSSIRQIGDVILVDDEDVIEDVDLEIYSNLIGCEVITETGELLGKVRGFRFDVDSGKLDTITIASLGLPLIPDQVVSTYELSIDEVVSSGPDRLIVFEGSEDRMSQLTVGVLERLGIGKAPWEREEDQYLAPIRPENQLPAGQPVSIPAPVRREPEPIEETWDEDNWEPEPIAMRQPEPRQMARYQEPEPMYDDDEEDNWSSATNRDVYDTRGERYDEPEYDDDYVEDNYVDEVTEDIDVPFEEIPATPAAALEEGDDDPWAEPEASPAAESEAEAEDDNVPLPKLELPQKEKQKEPEYEEEGY